jgi:uncharacterized protein (TIGR03089 family)
MADLPKTVVHALLASVAAHATSPFITFYDDQTGERVELSGATLANWVAKTANLLTDGLALGPGQVASVRLPPHWQTAAILLGCWTAGLTVDLGDGEAEAAVARAAVAFVVEGASASGSVVDTYALSLAPLGMPFPGGPPPRTQDYIVEVRQYADRMPPTATAPDQVALGSRTHADLVAAATDRTVPRLGRVLIDADNDPDPTTWLVAPLIAATSTVLCRHLDPTRLASRLAAEHAVLLPPHAVR